MKERGKKKRKKKREKKKEEKPPKVRQFLLPRFSFARSFAKKRIQKASSSVRAARIKRNETKRYISFERAAIEAEGGGRQGCTISQRAEWTRHLTCQDRRARGEYKRRWGGTEGRREGGAINNRAGKSWRGKLYMYIPPLLAHSTCVAVI